MVTCARLFHPGSPTYRGEIDQPHPRHNEKVELTIKELYPELDDAQLSEAEENLRAYFAVVWRIYSRLKREQPEIFDTPPHRP
jgi:hypothetical protein